MHIIYVKHNIFVYISLEQKSELKKRSNFEVRIIGIDFEIVRQSDYGETGAQGYTDLRNNAMETRALGIPYLGLGL